MLQKGEIMAKIFKPTYTACLPQGSKIVTRKGKRFAQFKRGALPILAPLTESGNRCKLETEAWYVRHKDASGKWQRVKGYTDRDATAALGVRLDRQAARQREGLVDPFEEHGRRGLGEHIEDFRRHLESKNCTPKHIGEVAGKLRRIVDGCKFKHIADISASSVETFLTDLRTGGMSAQTSNHYLRACKSFTRWLVQDRRTGDNVLAHLPMLNVRTDRRHDRRAITAAEFARLIESAESGPVIETVPGADRAMLYILAAWTGYRRGELASLTLRSFDLDSDSPTVRVLAAYSKRRRQDSVPLHSVVVQRFRAWLASRGDVGPDAPLFALRTAGGWPRRTAMMMKMDLERVGLPYVDEDGLYADFHSNRHSFISNLGKAGASLQMAQKLARHSDPKLTANVYTHLQVDDQAAAIEALPAPPGGKAAEQESDALRATGTDDGNPLSYPCHKPGTARHPMARCGTNGGPSGGEGDLPQTVKLERVDTPRHVVTQATPQELIPPSYGREDRS